MTQQMNLLESNRLKQRGMNLAACRQAELLERARRIAVSLAEEHGTTDIDSVVELMPDVPTGNWLGSVFACGRWERVGFIRSRRVSSHGRFVSNWRLRR